MVFVLFLSGVWELWSAVASCRGIVCFGGVAALQHASHKHCARKGKIYSWRFFQRGCSKFGEVTSLSASSGGLIPNVLKILRSVIARRDTGLRRGPASFAQRFTVKMLCKAALGV